MTVATPTPSLDTSALDVPDHLLPSLPTDWHSLSSAFLQSARKHSSKLAIVDSLGAKLTYSETLVRALVLSRVLARKLDDHPFVGLLIPPGAAAAIANLAISMLGKTAVNLNYSASKTVVDSSINQCEIKHVVTTPKLLDKIGYKPTGELIYLEDLKGLVTLWDKLWSALMAKFAPLSVLSKVRAGFGNQLDTAATVIFTSGSTGDPKGVVLTHRNLLSNVHQINNAIKLLPNEVVLGILPLFHSFGYTVSIWTVFLLGKQSVFHHSPLDYRIIPDLIEKHQATMIASSPTFMQSYCKRAKPGQLKSLVHILLGSERLKPEIAALIKETVGCEPLEGYGTTELSPVVSVNVPEQKKTRDGRPVYGNRPGTTGMPVPGTAIKTTHPETGEDLSRGSEGLIWVKGPQVMDGYLHKPEVTAKVLKNGWYCTGDIGYLDPDGFLKITGRLARFAKIGGEMVPLDGVENALQEVGEMGAEVVAVTAIPDSARGERLVVIYTDMGKPVEVIHQKLNASGIPKLWIPSARDFVKIDEIPCLSVGKRDLRKLKEIAVEQRGA